MRRAGPSVAADTCMISLDESLEGAARAAVVVLSRERSLVPRVNTCTVYFIG